MSNNEEVQPLVLPNLTAAHLKTWLRHDVRTKTNHPGVPDAILLTWSEHDIIRVYGL